MKRFKYLLSLFYGLLATMANAQTIHLEFPAFAGKTYELVLFQGDKSIKAIEDTIPANGKVALVVPPQYAPYTGMCRWLITNSAEGGGLDMVIPGRGFSVKCLSAQPKIEDIVFEGYDVLHELDRLFTMQQNMLDKYETMSRATQLYDSKHPLYASFQKEKTAQVLGYTQFQQDLKKNTNYNARMLPIFNLVRGIPLQITDDNDERAKLVNEYITNELNFDHLYTSGHWTGIIHSWVQMHTQLFKSKDGFAKAFEQISRRISEPAKYTDFVGKVTFALNKAGSDDFVASITPTVVNSGKITAYEGATMQVYVKALIGSKAPNIVLPDSKLLKSHELASDNYKQTLLVFFASDCGHCETLLKNLQAQYNSLQNKHIRVIALAADTDESLFLKSKASFPWADTYCDLKGMSGLNFRAFAVPGTPTMVLLNKQGIITHKTSQLEDILMSQDTSN
ncbi:thiol-disulfide isomerase/thioredoxin [Runella defluvii]|uniref:Thiol-disulfide isomerase/thioredoxin n=1 Tax=Runella defluvii TaxID=370973 RepID=A0A7W5ZSV6_9BACT|nr:TlpA disulfide reductase family protein [Runella defluvii]MBB3842256.1 thiol-disulfide isomerase/thioredoxin [Runella defluvii]